MRASVSRSSLSILVAYLVVVSISVALSVLSLRRVTFDAMYCKNFDGVEQLTRYLDLLNRDPLLAPVRGVFAAQEIRPQARVLAEDRGIRCVKLDYDALRGADDGTLRLF